MDYGGVFDLFYKLPALQEQGIRIHLHCFDYGRGPQPALEQFCASVHYYPRRATSFSRTLPHIVASRYNETLLNRLLQDDHPILMEGIHCSYLLTDPRFNNRKKFVRLHNVEWAYYRDLFLATTHPLKKIYFFRESNLLKKFEAMHSSDAVFLAVSHKDAVSYQQQFNCEAIRYLPLFLPPWEVASTPGVGSYCLYHGDLSVVSNVKVAKWLIKEVFAGLKIQLKIAGKRPPRSLQRLASRYENVVIIADPDETSMQSLIREAHLNVIPSHSATGIKLKLLNALFNGRHCLVNNATVDGTGLEHLCHIANTAAHMKGMVEQLYHQPFRGEEVAERKALLLRQFNNIDNAKKLGAMIFSGA